MRNYELFPHPADQGIRGYGETLEEAFQEIAKALQSIMADLDKVENKKTSKIKIEAEDTESLLIKWLNELLYLFDVKGTIYKEFKVKINKDKKVLKAEVKGEEYNIEKHGPGDIVKAITYNELKIEKREGKKQRWMVQCVVDM